ncbi:hypothetical protein LCGC14_3061810, partial [marine sediment metagenome]
YEQGTGRLDYRDIVDGLTPSPVRIDYDYDGLARVDTQTVTAGGADPLATDFEYDDADRRIGVVDPEFVETRYEFDLLGRQTRIFEDYGGLNRRTDFSYDRLSRLIARTAVDASAEPAETERTEYTYDLVGRRTKIVYPDSTHPQADSVRFAYDKASRLTSRTDQRDVVTAYTYDGRGLTLTRQASCSSCGSSFEPVLDEHTYDGLGRMTWARRQAGNPLAEVGESTLAYNDLSQMLSEQQELLGSGTTKTVASTHDQAGNRRTLTYPAPITASLEYEYDELSRITQIKRDAQQLVAYNYTGLYLDDRQVATTAGNQIVYDVAYDNHRRLDQIVDRAVVGGNPTVLAQFDYTF